MAEKPVERLVWNNKFGCPPPLEFPRRTETTHDSWILGSLSLKIGVLINYMEVVKWIIKLRTTVSYASQTGDIRKLQSKLVFWCWHPLTLLLIVAMYRKAALSRHKRHVTFVWLTAKRLTHGHSAQVSMIHECTGLVTISKSGVEQDSAVFALVDIQSGKGSN